MNNTLNAKWNNIDKKRLLLAPFLLGLMSSANAGIYYYPFFNEGIEVRCADGEPKHLISFKAGRVMEFEDSGDVKYEYPNTYLFPEESNKDYFYFPSTAGTKCSYRELSKEEREFYIKTAKDTCYGAELKIRQKFCYGWN